MSTEYQLVVIDPPWSYGKVTAPRVKKHRGRALGGHYKPMTIEEIEKQTPIHLAAPDVHVYLWVTNPKLPLAFALLEKWGLTYQTTLTWVKTTSAGETANNGLGWYWRGATEHILLATRGVLSIPTALRRVNVIHAPRTGHSRKPDAFYKLLDEVYPTMPRIDLYARSRHPGWEAWGDQVDQTAGQLALYPTI